MKKNCLIIFAKEPKKDKVKTRLRGYLSKTQCVNLYKAFLRDTIELADKISCGNKILAYESYGKAPRYLKKIAANYMFYKQKGSGLGERMHNACKFAKKTGVSKIVIIGSDSPALPASTLKNAFRLLNRADIVLGPSLDGGYYLIGLKSPCGELFNGIVWSSSKVLQNTLKNAKTLKKKVELLEKRHDVDDPKSLLILRNDLRDSKNKHLARWTRKFMNSVIHLTDKSNKIV